MSSTARAFNGTSDHGDSPAAIDYSANTSLAFNCWFKATSLLGVQIIFLHGATVTTGGLCVVLSGGTLSLYCFGQQIGLSPGVSLAAGTWYQLCGNMTGTSGVDPLINWWLNGSVLSHNGITNSGAQTPANLNMGVGYASASGGVAYFNGSLGHLAIWGDTSPGGGVSILGSTDITNLYGGGTAGARPSSIQAGRLLDYWPLSGASGANGSEPNQVGGRSALNFTGTSQDSSGPPVSGSAKPFLPPSILVPFGSHSSCL